MAACHSNKQVSPIQKIKPNDEHYCRVDSATHIFFVAVCFSTTTNLTVYALLVCFVSLSERNAAFTVNKKINEIESETKRKEHVCLVLYRFFRTTIGKSDFRPFRLKLSSVENMTQFEVQTICLFILLLMRKFWT